MGEVINFSTWNESRLNELARHLRREITLVGDGFIGLPEEDDIIFWSSAALACETTASSLHALCEAVHADLEIADVTHLRGGLYIGGHGSESRLVKACLGVKHSIHVDRSSHSTITPDDDITQMFLPEGPLHSHIASLVDTAKGVHQRTTLVCSSTDRGVGIQICAVLLALADGVPLSEALSHVVRRTGSEQLEADGLDLLDDLCKTHSIHTTPKLCSTKRKDLEHQPLLELIASPSSRGKRAKAAKGATREASDNAECALWSTKRCEPLGADKTRGSLQNLTGDWVLPPC